MEHIVWSPQMSLGVPAMDSAHEELLQEVARLEEVPDGEFGDGLYALIARLERDFLEEEALMEEIDSPTLMAHREQHARVLSGLHHVVPRVMAGDIAAGREALGLLPQWFLIHLATLDTALALTLEMEKETGKRPAADAAASGWRVHPQQ